MHRRSNDRIEVSHPGAAFQFDALQQHNGVVDHDPSQGYHAQQGHEAKEGLAQQQADHNTDQTQGDGDQNHQRFTQRVELPHKQQQDDEASDRQLIGNRFIGIP